MEIFEFKVQRIKRAQSSIEIEAEDLKSARKILNGMVKKGNFNTYFDEGWPKYSVGKEYVTKVVNAPDVPDISDAELAFGINDLSVLPTRSQIPSKYKSLLDPWRDITHQWFYKGLGDNVKFYAKEGIDGEKAFKVLKAILTSWGPKHEDKMEGISLLMYLWFDKIEDWRKE